MRAKNGLILVFGYKNGGIGMKIPPGLPLRREELSTLNSQTLLKRVKLFTLFQRGARSELSRSMLRADERQPFALKWLAGNSIYVLQQTSGGEIF